MVDIHMIGVLGEHLFERMLFTCRGVSSSVKQNDRMLKDSDYGDCVSPLWYEIL